MWVYSHLGNLLFSIAKNKNESNYVSRFDSRDPALPLECMNFDEAKRIFLNDKECLY